MVPRRYWTEAESSQLAALIADGKSVLVIAKLLGRTPGGVAARAKFLGFNVVYPKRARRAPAKVCVDTPFSRLF